MYFGSGNLLRNNLDEKDRIGWERYKECFYSEEEALEGALSFWKDKMTEYVRDGIGEVTHEYLMEIARRNVTHNMISVCVVSPERKKFSTLKEMRKYYTENILNVEPDKRYDFLLSLLQCDERFYDEDGNYLRSRNHHQILDEYTYRLLPLFSRENAKDIKYGV